MLNLKDLSFGYKKDLIFKDLNFDVNYGDRVGVMGASGIGKSTLLRLIMLLDYPEKGAVIYDNKIIYSHDTQIRQNLINDYRAKIGVVYQELNLWPHLSVLENVTLPLIIKRKIPKDKAEKSGLEIIEKVGLAEYASYMPRELSVGMKQRCAIARTLVFSPELLLMDEITSSLDGLTAIGVLEVIKMIIDDFDLTLVLISHDIEVINYLCNKKYAIINKKIVKI